MQALQRALVVHVPTLARGQNVGDNANIPWVTTCVIASKAEVVGPSDRCLPPRTRAGVKIAFGRTQSLGGTANAQEFALMVPGREEAVPGDPLATMTRRGPCWACRPQVGTLSKGIRGPDSCQGRPAQDVTT